MVKEFSHGLMVIDMKVSTKMILNTVKEYLHKLKAIDMKASIKMIKEPV